jgi:hypothetical protein
MLNQTMREIRETQRKLEELQRQLQAEKNQMLLALPAKNGFADVASLIAALQSAAGSSVASAASTPAPAPAPVLAKGAIAKRRGRPPGKSAAKAALAVQMAPALAGKKRRTRTVITPALLTQVKELVGAGSTEREIVQALGISDTSVQRIKKKLGLSGRARGARG